MTPDPRPPVPSGSWPPILTPDLCALMLGLKSGREALKLARRRGLPSVRRGKRVLFLTESIVAYLKSQEQPAISDRELMRGS